MKKINKYKINKENINFYKINLINYIYKIIN
jgi:hypothetical protein